MITLGHRLESAGPSDPPETLLLPITREQLLYLLPRNAVVAEIGVATGGFSQAILQTCQPSKLAFIDLWETQDDERYRTDPSNATPSIQQERYQTVLNLFSPLIAAGRVTVHRGLSATVADSFPDSSFDWIFVDANHTYDGVITDLRKYYPKVKRGGFIVGHDYTNQDVARSCHFGVIEAVHQLCTETNTQFMALTSVDQFPTYILGKDLSRGECERWAAAVSDVIPGVVAVRDFLNHRFAHRVFMVDGRRRWYISI